MVTKLLIPKSAAVFPCHFLSFMIIFYVCNYYIIYIMILTMFYLHLLRDFVCACSGKAVSSCQHPVLAHN